MTGPRRSRTILYVHSSDDAYGADRVLLQMARSSRERGWEPIVALPDDVAPGWLSVQLADAGIRVVRGPLAIARRRYLRPVGLPGYAIGLLRARRYVRALIHSGGVATVHVNTTAVLVAALLGRPGSVRIVWHVHEIVVRPRAVAWLLRRLPARTADRTIAISDAVRTWLKAPGPGQPPIQVIPNGLPDRPTTTAPDEPVRVLFVGRLNRWKGYDVLVDAVAAIRDLAGVELVIVGSPPDGEAWRMEDLLRRVRERGISDRTTIAGYADDAETQFDAATIVVVPSVWPEPFGLVTLEAMRAGRAVIATAHGGSLELIRDGVDGLLVPPGDVDALAGALRRLVGDAGLRERLGQAARATYESRYTEDRFLAAIDRLHEDVLQ